MSQGTDWLLVGAPASIATMVASTAALAPAPGERGTKVRAILLCNGDLDQTLGLLALRESEPLTIISTDTVRRGFLEGNVLAKTLQRTPGQITWLSMKPGERRSMNGLQIEMVAVPGKVPLHLEGQLTPSDEDNVAYAIEDERGRSVVIAPSVASPSPAVSRILEEADLLFFDGSFWTDDELERRGAGKRRARQMGHWPLGGPEGSLQALASARGRRVLLHINNTNPILIEDSAEAAEVRAAGVEIGFDGMEIEL